MQNLKIKNLYFKYQNSSMPIYENLNLEFTQGWSCIVGANGSGKSTLLKLISKELVYDIGTIKGNDLVYYCEQSTQNEPELFEEFMSTYTTNAFKIRDALGVNDEWLYMWDNLSHGERKRVQIAIALYIQPDILLLDEPTNHLDIKNKKIVSDALKDFKGIGILVSHDRELLDHLSSNTIILKNGNIDLYKSNFTTAMDESQREVDFLQKTQDKQNHEMKKLKKSMQSQKEKVSQSAKRLSKKSVGKSDSDTRAKLNQARLTGKDKNESMMVKKIQSKQAQLSSKLVKTDKTYTLGINIESTKSNNIFPIMIKDDTLTLSDTKQLSFNSREINQGDKIGIVGENGSGKSSFIEYLFKSFDFKDQFLYIPQEISKEDTLKIFEEVNSLPTQMKGEIYTIIRKLSSDPEKLLDSHIPSAGEIRKLIIAKGLLYKPSLIILDEPTNHMDLDSIISLENALDEYNGTLLIISHDIVFLNNITNMTWNFTKKNENEYIIDS
ncbi:ATP-binding cassette domain-containing protein [Arcobacteraceae bacterium]|nr:ATP-binding cassette domain-containing protein [Arcobacteraceae bacterium]